MALTKARNIMIEGAPVNVKDFGAVGDGTTDDTAAIQAAIDATSGSVYIPAGSYKVLPQSGTITDSTNPFYWGCLKLKDNVKVFGDGVASKLIGDNSIVGGIYDAVNRNKGIFTFVGNDSGYSVSETVNVVVENLWIDKGYNGATIGGAQNITFQNIKLTNQGLDGFYVGMPGTASTPMAKYITIKDFEIDTTGRQGISVLRGKHLTFKDGLIKNIAGSPGAAIDIEPEEHHADNIMIDNITADSCIIGFLIHGWTGGNQTPDHITVQNCTTLNSSSKDFNVQFGDNIIIKNNRVFSSGTTTKGLRLYKCTNSIVEGNYVEGGNIELTVEDTLVTKNILAGDGAATSTFKLLDVNGQFTAYRNAVINNNIKDANLETYSMRFSRINDNAIENGHIRVRATNSTVQGNTVHNSPDYGIKIDYAYSVFNSSNNSVTGNAIYDTQTQSIWIKQEKGGVVSNNVMFNANLAGNTGNDSAFIYLENIDEGSVVGNTCQSDAVNTPVNGVHAPNTGTTNTVMLGNVVRNYTGTGYLMYWATSCVSANNIS